jgi:hypothetical protein
MPKKKKKPNTLQSQPIIINFPLKELLEFGKQTWDYFTKPAQEGKNNVAPALPEAEPKKPNIPQIARY